MSAPESIQAVRSTALKGLPPILGDNARILVLGSMPGAESLRRREYYGHPRNHFWRIIEDTLGIPHDQHYGLRVEALRRAGVAVWDVLASCTRQGSLDTAIDRGSMRVNAVEALVASQPSLQQILFNGSLAETIYLSHIKTRVDQVRPVAIKRMPSTSPANASWRYEQKLAAWRPMLLTPCITSKEAC